MTASKCSWQSPEDWSQWSQWLAAGLHASNRWRLPVLLMGILFAHGRRTVTAWLRAAGVSADYQDYYYFLAALGRKTHAVATQLLLLVLRTVPLPHRLLAVLDDTPTKRYGPKVEGAGIHRNPTPGPADQKYLYGHIWVSLSLALRHPHFGPLGLPLQAMLYVRRQTIAKIPKWRGWTFATKLVLAARLVEWLAPLVKQAGKTLWIVVDGGYVKAPFLKRAARTGATIIGRLRKDAALRDLPRKLRRGQRRRGRPPKYGKHRISLAKRAAHREGWQVAKCTVYNHMVTKPLQDLPGNVPAHGRSDPRGDRPGGGRHVASLLLDPTRKATAVEIIEAFADRATIEQDFHDVKEVWGAGQQQVRNIWTNLAVSPSQPLDAHVWWSFDRGTVLTRSFAIGVFRRGTMPLVVPSHADRRNALRRYIMEQELSAIAAARRLPRKILQLAQRLLALAN